jgi:hypothetical protein
MKKTWETPQLIVLVRNNPQEAVLSLCKGTPSPAAAGTPVSPTTNYYGCMQPFDMANTPVCMDCSTLGAS